MEWQMIQRALRTQGGNKTAAARSLGISLRTLYNKLEAKSVEAQSPSSVSPA
jgi:DNA-binding NtrC family response regulator